MEEKISQQVISFINASPSAFHAVENMKTILNDRGFKELNEETSWDVLPGGSYYTTRNHSSLIAFKVGNTLNHYQYQIVASHSDSPTFKVKGHGTLEVRGKYTQLNTEPYGGMIFSSWFDKPLSIAGRVMIQNCGKIEERLINIDRDLTMIPHVAIHMDRTANDGAKYNPQIDLLPLLGGVETPSDALEQLIAKELCVDPTTIMSHDLYLYNRTHPSFWGYNNDYMSSRQIDNLECGYTTLLGFLESNNENTIQVYGCFDNEEVGSSTKQGAGSTMLYDTLRRIHHSLGKSDDEFYKALASSFMVSADNAHAVHPNHPEKTEQKNCVFMNEGIVIKTNANQAYTTDAISMAITKQLCLQANVPFQIFANRSDVRGGSTLGNVSSTKVSINSVDIGLAQLAMHSAYETAGVKDVTYMVKFIQEFFNNTMIKEGNGYFIK